MQSNQHIADLPSLLKKFGVSRIVVCPGSRNAPLVQVLYRAQDFQLYSIVDERSAGYVAMGMARQLGEPVVVVTTSGTATLNLGPAVAEAYFQKIPLVVLTADRPKEWPPQFSNQIVNQERLFLENSKGFLGLPIDINSEAELDSVMVDIQNLLKRAVSGEQGPVHMNIPLREPLYTQITEASGWNGKDTIETVGKREAYVREEEQHLISKGLVDQKKVLIVAGSGKYSAEEELLLISLATHFNVVVIAENITNLTAPYFIHQPDLVLGSLPAGDPTLIPDLVITMGGAVVSKKTRLFIQSLESESVKVLDSFPYEVLHRMVLEHDGESTHSYLADWKGIEQIAFTKVDAFMSDHPFCNLTAIGGILNTIPDKAVVHLGNSGTIRYSQLFPRRGDLTFLSNRGTSGIDGSLSSAVGAAMVSEQLHLAILGDLSFIYDSNGMWNRDLPQNLRIIVLNDEGGGIFRIIEGPEKMPFFEEYSVAHHPVSLSQLAGAFGLKYLQAADYIELNEGLSRLFAEGKECIVLEVITANSENSRIFKQFYKSLQS